MIVYKRHTHYHETDQMGVIHHSKYLCYLEEARIFMLDKIGISYKKMEEMGIISPILSINVVYIKACKFDEDLDIELKITKYSGIQIFVSYEIKEHNSQELRIKATSRSCFIKDNKVISLKKECPEYDLKLKELEERQ
jgi:acyl-CoA thioester hydrolase